MFKHDLARTEVVFSIPLALAHAQFVAASLCCVLTLVPFHLTTLLPVFTQLQSFPLQVFLSFFAPFLWIGAFDFFDDSDEAALRASSLLFHVFNHFQR